MEFVFFCAESGRTFRSRDFRIADNKGVKKDPYGNKVLDAKVILRSPCPYCSKFHDYKASELTCPFESEAKRLERQ